VKSAAARRAARVKGASMYIRKTTRPYIRKAWHPERRQRIEEWYRDKLALGSQKELAARLGVSIPYVQQVVAAYRLHNSIKVP
jgi:hypothetical protein